MQLDLGLDVVWLSPDEVDERNPTMAPGQTLGGTYFAGDGYINPPRNVTAYAVALARSGVEVREQVRFPGLRRDGDRSPAWRPPRGRSRPVGRADRRPEAGRGRRLAGVRIPVGGVRHQIAVTEPHPDLDPSRLPMVFDLASGLYWRPKKAACCSG